MTRLRIALALATAALAATLAALAPAAQAAVGAPRLVGTPALTSFAIEGTTLGRYVSIGATVRLDRAFASVAEQHRYSVVAAPRLRAGQTLPDALFGGSSLGRLRRHAHGAWYRAEAQQLRLHRSVRPGARWQVALARGGRIVGAIGTVTLRRG